MSWALEAIEREAMARARREVLKYEDMSTFRFMGYSPEQLLILITDFRGRYANAGPQLSVEQMRELVRRK